MRQFLIIATVFIIITFGYSCGGGGGTSGGVGFVPKIIVSTALDMNDPDNPESDKSFNPGDIIGFGVKAQDDDKNMKTLWVTVYYQTLATPYEGPTSFQLPKQTSQTMTYLPIGSLILSGDLGIYRVELQIEDERGNMSKVSIVNITLE